MKVGNAEKRNWRTARLAAMMLAVVLALAVGASSARGDEPYARSRDYDLQHSKIVLKFDVEKKQVIGDVTHSLAILRDGTSRIWFDSVGLSIHAVTVNKATAKFETTEE